MRMIDCHRNHSWKIYYDILSGVMAIIAVIIVMLEFLEKVSYNQKIVILFLDNIVYMVFVLDYIIRMILSNNKKVFLKRNFIDFVAILPFGFISFFHYGRIVKLVRVLTYILRLIKNMREVLSINVFIYSIGFILVIIIIGALGIYIFESPWNEGISSYGDALWWSLVTVTTIGYGDIVISTVGGRIIASILMITGVIFLSLLTGTISSYYLKRLSGKNSSIVANKLEYDKINELSRENMIDISNMSLEDKRSLLDYYFYLKNRQHISKR